MRTFLPTLLGVCALAAATAALAQPATPSAAPDWAAKRAQMQQAFFDKIDTNHDGVISRTEYQAWVDARFAKFDPTGKGSVTAADIAAIAASSGMQEIANKRAEAFIKRYDTSGTGSLSKADFEAKEMARFDRLSGGTDTLTPAQLTAAHMQEHAHGAWRKDAMPAPSTTSN
ncbi:MAG: EF-hand domain-containing protein [Rhodanobacter sp.]|jgi:hypothetical protein|nr:EF-hand domain-containing protein [Rhodanobacter sp.]